MQSIVETIPVAKYRLKPHVYVCRTTDYVVLLDARTGRYWGVNESVSRVFESRIEGWPTASERDSSEDCLEHEAMEIISQMQGAGMLDNARPGIAPQKPKIPPRAARQLIEGYERVQARIGIRDALAFAGSLAIASILLRFCSIESLANRFRRRRGRMGALSNLSHVRTGFDHSRAQVAVAKFETMCLFFVSDLDRCLFKSVALAEFLSTQGLFPACMFGVTTSPFSAHCWLQEGDIAINDAPGNVNEFVPILAI